MVLLYDTGYALLFESMLDSVLIARDLFLRPGGAILPDIANIYIALGTYASEGLDFWEDIYGLSMTPIAETIRKNRTSLILLCSVMFNFHNK